MIVNASIHTLTCFLFMKIFIWILVCVINIQHLILKIIYNLKKLLSNYFTSKTQGHISEQVNERKYQTDLQCLGCILVSSVRFVHFRLCLNCCPHVLHIGSMHICPDLKFRVSLKALTLFRLTQTSKSILTRSSSIKQ